jgi:hypothetical protein
LKVPMIVNVLNALATMGGTPNRAIISANICGVLSSHIMVIATPQR